MSEPTDGASNSSSEGGPPSELDSSEAVAKFLAAYRSDISHDRIQPVEAYVRQFGPLHAVAIEREYALLEDDSETCEDADSSVQTIGPYRIVSKIGSGGQAVVYRAVDDRLGRVVALKVLDLTVLPGSLTDQKRFRREAELTAGLDHPGIAAVLDVGQDLSQHTAYIAMRLVPGETLAHHIMQSAKSAKGAVELPTSSNRRTDQDQLFIVTELIEKVARALHVAHQRNLIHRDIKPGNIMVTPDGDPVILDFGLARGTVGDDLALTRSGELLGTPYYMSPEQLRECHTALDRRTDIYSLGVTLWECLTLARPFEGANRETLYHKILHEPPSDTTGKHKAIPKDLRIVLETAMEKDVDRRYPTALAMAEDLRHIRQFEPITARPLPMALRTKRWVQRNPAVATFFAMMTVALCATLLLLRTVQLRNVQLQRTSDAANLQKVAESLLDSRGLRGKSLDARRALLSKTGGKRGLAWKWLDARSAPLERQGPFESVGPVRSVAFTQRGGRILANRQDSSTSHIPTRVSNGELYVIDIGKGGEETSLGPAFTAQITPDGKLIVAGDGRSIRLLDATSYEPKCRARHVGKVSALSCSSDGRIAAAGGANGVIRTWRIEETQDRIELVDVTPPTPMRFGRIVRAMDFSPDGARLLIAGDRDEAWIVDAIDGSKLATCSFYVADQKRALASTETPLRLLTARFSPNGKLVLLSGRIGRVALFSAESGSFVRELHPHRAAWTGEHVATDALFDPTGRFVISCGLDQAVRVHEVRSGQLLDSFYPGGYVLALAMDTGGSRIATSITDRRAGLRKSNVSVWNLGDLSIPVDLVGNDEENIAQVITTKDQRYAFSVGGMSVRKYELATGRQVFAIRDRQRRPLCIALRPGKEEELAIGYTLGDCRVVSAQSGKTIQEWPRDPESESIRQKLVWPDSPDDVFRAAGFHCLSYSPDGSTLVGGLGSELGGRDVARAVPILVFNAEGLELERRLEGHVQSVNGLYFNRDGNRLASHQGGALIFWRVRDWQMLKTYTGPVNRISADRTNRLYAWASSGVLTIYDFESGEVISELPNLSTGHLWDIEFDASGTQMLVATTTGAAIWDVPPKNRLLSLSVGIPSKSAWRGAAHFVGDKGIVIGGASGFLSYHEVKPNREQFLRRQVEWAAGQCVKDLLATGLSVVDAGRAVKDDLPFYAKLHLGKELRDAARRILAGTNEDPLDVFAKAFLVILDPRHDPKAYRYILRTLKGVEPAAESEPRRYWQLYPLIGIAQYRLGNDLLAEKAFEKACKIDRLRHWDQDPALLADVQSTTWFFRAMSAHRSGNERIEQLSLASAWAAGVGGKYDALLAREAYRRIGQTPRSGSEAASPAAGRPNADRTRISANAWCPLPKSQDQHVLELSYLDPLKTAEIRIFEVNKPGAVVQVEFEDETGRLTERCSVKNDAKLAGTFVVKAPTSIGFDVKTIRLYLDDNHRTGIDTVQLVAADGDYRWPIRANALVR